jgi:outer membrane lipoprotein LolB
LGEQVPLTALFSWLRGRAWPGAVSVARADGAPGFEQLGWQIDLERWADGAVQAERMAPPVITVRARVELPG